jgi:transposase-like protein
LRLASAGSHLKDHLKAHPWLREAGWRSRMNKADNSFRYFNSSPGRSCWRVMMCFRFPLFLRNAEDMLFEREIDICHGTVRKWRRRRFDPLPAKPAR